MDKVYIVTRGCYSDYSIVRVFSDKETATAFAERESIGAYESCEVEEHELFGGDISGLLEWYKEEQEREAERKRLANIEYPLYRVIITWKDGERTENLVMDKRKGSPPPTKGWRAVKKSPDFITDGQGFAGPRAVYGPRNFRLAQEEWLDSLNETVLVKGIKQWTAWGEGSTEELAKAIAYEQATMAQAEYEGLT